MWKCFKCETINEEDVCAVCGETRPKPESINRTDNGAYNNVPQNGEMINLPLIVGIIVIFILLLLIANM